MPSLDLLNQALRDFDRWGQGVVDQNTILFCHPNRTQIVVHIDPFSALGQAACWYARLARASQVMWHDAPDGPEMSCITETHDIHIATILQARDAAFDRVTFLEVLKQRFCAITRAKVQQDLTELALRIYSKNPELCFGNMLAIHHAPWTRQDGFAFVVRSHDQIVYLQKEIDDPVIQRLARRLPMGSSLTKLVEASNSENGSKNLLRTSRTLSHAFPASHHEALRAMALFGSDPLRPL